MVNRNMLTRDAIDMPTGNQITRASNVGKGLARCGILPTILQAVAN